MSTVTDAPKKIKLALCLEKDFSPLTINIHELLAKEGKLEDRATCELDFTKIQPIAYITLVDNSELVPKFFMYMRGPAGGESRLTGLCSIGLGGHIDTVVSENSPRRLGIFNDIIEAASRELHEEVGIVIDSELFAKNIMGITSADDSPVYGRPTVLHDPNSEVGSVHIGVSFLVSVHPEELGELEEGVILKGQWLTAFQITELENSLTDPVILEPWSKSVLAKVSVL